MRLARQFVTNRETASGSNVETDLEPCQENWGSFQKSLKNLSVAVDRWGGSAKQPRLSQIGHPIALKALSGERLLKQAQPGGPGSKREALRQRGQRGVELFEEEGCGHGGKSDGSSDG